jgi:hypothetical protein
MAGFRLSTEVEAELDGIWLHVARESGSIDIANRLVDAISERFLAACSVSSYEAQARC